MKRRHRSQKYESWKKLIFPHCQCCCLIEMERKTGYYEIVEFLEDYFKEYSLKIERQLSIKDNLDSTYNGKLMYVRIKSKK